MIHFICAECGKNFESDRDDAEAVEEFRRTFGREPDLQDLDCVVCDDCYRKMTI